MEYTEYVIWAETLEELEEAVQKVDTYMQEAVGRNIISYQIIGDAKKQPWDSGYITDEALKELQWGFIVLAVKESVTA